jgi:hypothetical protein
MNSPTRETIAAAPPPPDHVREVTLQIAQKFWGVARDLAMRDASGTPLNSERNVERLHYLLYRLVKGELDTLLLQQLAAGQDKILLALQRLAANQRSTAAAVENLTNRK